MPRKQKKTEDDAASTNSFASLVDDDKDDVGETSSDTKKQLPPSQTIEVSKGVNNNVKDAPISEEEGATLPSSRIKGQLKK